MKRSPTAAERRLAACTEPRTLLAGGSKPEETYLYPVGDTVDGMNTSGSDPWPRLAPVGTTKRGINGL